VNLLPTLHTIAFYGMLATLSTSPCLLLQQDEGMRGAEPGLCSRRLATDTACPLQAPGKTPCRGAGTGALGKAFGALGMSPKASRAR
jgi:hypothetical protein